MPVLMEMWWLALSRRDVNGRPALGGSKVVRAIAFVLKQSDDRTQAQERDDIGGSTGEAVATQNPRIKLAQNSALQLWIASLVLNQLGRFDAYSGLVSAAGAPLLNCRVNEELSPP